MTFCIAYIHQGHALVFAPGRNGTFDAFCELTKAKFVMERCDQYDDHLWSIHSQVSASLLRWVLEVVLLADVTLQTPLALE